jgi:hypothetical protein
MIVLRNIQSCGVEKDSTFEIIDSSNTPVAKAIVFTHEGSIDISSIYTEYVPRAVEAIIEYAKQNNRRIVEFPQIYLYDDGLYKNDVIFHDFKNDTDVKQSQYQYDSDIDITEHEEDSDDVNESNQRYFKKKIEKKRELNIDPHTWGINGKIWKYLKDKYANVMTLMIQDDPGYFMEERYPSELKWNTYVPVLCIPHTLNIKPQNRSDIRVELFEEYDWFERDDCTPMYSSQVKGVIIQGCKGFDNACKIVFPESLFINLETKECVNDLYLAICINGRQLVKTHEEARNFRLNKLLNYSDADYYNIAWGYGYRLHCRMYIVNDLIFPQKNICYTEQAYTILQYYAKDCENPPVKEEFSLELVSSSKKKNRDTSTTKTRGYIYLIRRREHERMNENVYKHGKTKIGSPTLRLPRFEDYEKESELCYTRMVDVERVDWIETKITKTFMRMFTKHSDGRESFIGNYSDMIREIDKIINEIEC